MRCKNHECCDSGSWLNVFWCRKSNRNPLDLVERNLVAGAVVELRRARAGMVSHGLSVFERAAVGEKIRESGRPKCVAAHVGVDAGLLGAPADHAPDIDAVHRQRRQRAAMPVGGAEQGSPFRSEQPGRMHVGVEIGFEIVMRRHLVDLAAFSLSRSRQRLPSAK